MARQPLGKTLLRNVIRHTDAHNKIQEEMEMWKMRDWEVHTSHHTPPDGVRRLQCDRVPDLSRGSRDRVSEHDDRDSRDARYYSRKLYEFEANDPDRWGHSGFKELYPEEFESDSEKSGKKTGRRKANSKSDVDGKKSKKSSRKKKKKKKKKKKDESSSSSSSDDDDDDKRKTKSRHKDKKAGKSRVGEDDGRGRKRRKQEAGKEEESRKRRRRKEDEESAGDSSGD